jgi:putative DNA primase/helicase
MNSITSEESNSLIIPKIIIEDPQIYEWDLILGFAEAMQNADINYNGRLISDGTIHRFASGGVGNKDAWYVFFGLGGAFGDWSRGIHQTWGFKHDGLSTADLAKRNEQVEHAKKVAEEERRLKQQETHQLAMLMWDEATTDGHSLYLSTKKVSPYGIRFSEGSLLIPVQDSSAKIWSLQTINSQGEKRFLIGGRKKGCFHKIGDMEDGKPIFLSEGYATAASIHLATGHATVVAFDAGNLMSVLESLRVAYPKSKITIAGDDDCWNEHNIGREKAEQAGQKYGCRYVFPTFRDQTTKPTDFNDLMILEGIEEVARQINAVMAESTTTLTTLKSYTLKELLALDIKPRQMILNPIIPEQGLVMIHAPRGVGKTHVALMIAYTVAVGGSLFDDKWTCSKPNKVLVIDGEMPLSVMQERLAKIIKSAKTQVFDDKYLQIITPDVQKEKIGDLSTPHGQRIVEEHLKDVKLVILDNYSSLCRTGRENDSESWVPLQDWFLELRRRGISVLLIHHSNKSGGQRGTSRKEDVLDTIITLRKPNSYEPKDGARFEVHYEKARSFYGDDALPFEAWLKQDDGKLYWQVKKIEQVELDQILELHQQNFTQREIAEKLDLSPATVNRRLKEVKGQEIMNLD